MKKINFNFFLLLIITVIAVSCGDDKNSSTEPENGIIDQAVVGSWELTNILAPFATTPAAVGIALTVIFNADGTMQLTTIDVDGTVVDTGTWSTSDGKITITLEGEEPGSSNYSIGGNIATFSEFQVEFQGTTILATLEFTKRT